MFKAFVVTALILVSSAASAANIGIRNSAVGAFLGTDDAGGTLPGFSLNLAGDNQSLLVVTVSGEISSNATSITYGGQALTAGPSQLIGNAPNINAASVWYLLNPAAASGDVVLTKFNEPADGGYTIGVASFGTDGQFLAPVSTDTDFYTGSRPGPGGVPAIMTTTLSDAASPGNAFVAIASLSANGGNGNGNNLATPGGFDNLFYNVNEAAEGGYVKVAGYAIKGAGGSTDLTVTLDSNRHVMAGMAFSATAVPEPGTLVLRAGNVGVGAVVALVRRAG